MLSNATVFATLPVGDLQRAHNFYTQTLGLPVVKQSARGILFKAGNNSQLYVYQRGPSKADHTLAAFEVEDLEAEVSELTQKGIVFEQYDVPGIKTDERGIAVSEDEDEKAAWFKDPDGNIIGISQTI